MGRPPTLVLITTAANQFELMMQSLHIKHWKTINHFCNPNCFMVWLVILLGHTFVVLCDKYLPEFNDKEAFEISWLNSDPAASLLGALQGMDSVVVRTVDKEQYRCFLPKLKKSTEEIEDLVKGDHPEDLLSGILSLKETKCSYRLEPYWTYEVCHGLHVRQFHEEKGNGPGKVKLQEFYLGRVIESKLTFFLSILIVIMSSCFISLLFSKRNVYNIT